MEASATAVGTGQCDQMVELNVARNFQKLPKVVSKLF